MSAPVFSQSVYFLPAILASAGAQDISLLGAVVNVVPNSFTGIGLPPGLAFSTSALGHVTGTPTKVGFYKATITATNADGSASATFYFTVNPAPPVVLPVPDQTAVVGTAYSYQLSMQYGNPSLWVLTNLPPGLSVSATGLISGTPTQAGRYYAYAGAQYGVNSAYGSAILFAVNPPDTPTDGPVTTRRIYMVAVAGTFVRIYTNILKYSNPSAFSVTGLPPHLVYEDNEGIAYGYVSGSVDAVGVYTIDVAGEISILPTSGHGPLGTTTITLNVVAPPATSSVAAGSPISIQAGTNSALNGPLTVYGLPPGLTMSDSGLITGTGTTPGDYTVIVTDGTSTQVIPITVTGVTPPEVVPTGADNPNLVIEINLLSGAAAYTNNLPPLYYGDQFVVEINCVPTTQAGDVANVTFFVKEKGGVRQYQELLSGLGVSTDGRKFLCPLTTLAGDFLLHSLLLLDDVAPSSGVTYDLQCRYQWSGRKRKSSALDFVVNRPDDLDPAEP